MADSNAENSLKRDVYGFLLADQEVVYRHLDIMIWPFSECNEGLPPIQLGQSPQPENHDVTAKEARAVSMT
ncbi:MAG: hypothetical protein SNJ82_10710 [Gemmataceae bacterium]